MIQCAMVIQYEIESPPFQSSLFDAGWWVHGIWGKLFIGRMKMDQFPTQNRTAKTEQNFSLRRHP